MVGVHFLETSLNTWFNLNETPPIILVIPTLKNCTRCFSEIPPNNHLGYYPGFRLIISSINVSEIYLENHKKLLELKTVYWRSLFEFSRLPKIHHSYFTRLTQDSTVP